VTLLEVRHVRKIYEGHGRTVEAIGDLSFSCAAGELVCIVGPSGARQGEQPADGGVVGAEARGRARRVLGAATAAFVTSYLILGTSA
jgi:ABC-type uncharacterized transport system ATPase subunit